MTLLEAVQRLNETLTADGLDCIGCFGPLYQGLPHGGHVKPECPVLQLPRIAAVLEAAEAVGRAYSQETVATWGVNLGSPLLAAVDALDRALEG